MDPFSCEDENTKFTYIDVSEKVVPPKSSSLIGFCIINHPFWGSTIFRNTHIVGG